MPQYAYYSNYKPPVHISFSFLIHTQIIPLLQDLTDFLQLKYNNSCYTLFEIAVHQDPVYNRG